MQKEIEAAILEYWASIESLDPSRYRQNFTADATLEDPVGANKIQGADAIAAFFRDGLHAWNIDRVTPTIKQVIVGTGESMEAAVAWDLTVLNKEGKSVVIEGIGLFKFDNKTAGDRLLLESVREFWNPQQFTSQSQSGQPPIEP